MNVTQIARAEFDLSKNEDVNKFNQFQNIDNVIKAIVEFNKFLDESSEKHAKDSSAGCFKFIKEKYVEIYAKNGVTV